MSASTPSLESVRFDIALKRGIVVRGRVTNKATGKHVITTVSVCRFSDHAYGSEFRGYRGSYQITVDVEPDATYQAVPLPGHSILPIRPADGVYLRGMGAKSIQFRER